MAIQCAVIDLVNVNDRDEASFSDESHYNSKSSLFFFFCLDSPPSGHLIQGQWWQLCHKTFNPMIAKAPEGSPFIKIKKLTQRCSPHTLTRRQEHQHQECEPDGPADTAQGALVIYVR